MTRGNIWIRWIVALGALAFVSGACTPASRAKGPYPVAATFGEGLLRALADLHGPPLGANDWTCKPSSAHPRPVILAHGTLGNMADSWQAISPSLANEGYCVFALNYGARPDDLLDGTAEISASAMRDFGPFVDLVLAATGAKQVDVIGHSQGALMPRYWMRHGESVTADGTPKIARFIGVGPPSHGTTFYGLAALVPEHTPAWDSLSSWCGACGEQVTGSSFIRDLIDPTLHPGDRFAGELQPGVSYTMLMTKYDNVVTPPSNGAILLPGVSNVVVQDHCAADHADHLSLVYDPVAIGIIENVLDEHRAEPPPCVGTEPVFGIDWTR